MTQLYTRSSGGDNADDGLSWANAKATVAGAIAAMSAGDRLAVRNDHSEGGGATITWAFPGTAPSPNIVAGVSDSGEPPTTLATGAAVATTTNFTINITGYCYIYGISFSVGSSTSSTTLSMSNNNGGAYQVYEVCAFAIASTGGSSSIVVGVDGATSGKRVVWKDCALSFAASTNRLNIRTVDFEWNGGSVGGTTPAAFMQIAAGATGRNAKAEVRNVDFSAWSSGFHMCEAVPGGSTLLVEKCKLPASWSGNLNNNPTGGGRSLMLDCQISGGGKIRFLSQELSGVVSDDTSVYRSGGSEDEGTPFSFKFVSTTNTAYPTALLQSPPIIVDNQTTGSAVTLYAELLHDSATALTDAEVWAVVDYMGTASTDFGSSVTTRCSVLASPSNVGSSSETWAGSGGMSNPNKQRIAITFTPQVAGDVTVRVYLAKASKTVYLCGDIHV